jgi:hypothetical protein
MLLTALAVSSAHAQTQTRSKEYLEVIQGALVEFEAGNYAEARVLFEQAHGMRPSARTLRGMALASFELREYVRAGQELNAALVDGRQPLSEPQRKEALTLLLRLERYVGRLEIRATPKAATVTLDGRRVSGEFEIELGKHELTVQAPGYRDHNRVVIVEGGKRQVVEVTLNSIERNAANAAAPVPQAVAGTIEASLLQHDLRDDEETDSVLTQWWFWTAVGVVAVGGIVTAVALSSTTRTEPPVRGNTGPAIQVLSWSR